MRACVRTAGSRGRGQWPRGMPERGRRWSSSQSQCRTRCRRGRRGPRTLRSGCLLLPCLLFVVYSREFPASAVVGWFQENDGRKCLTGKEIGPRKRGLVTNSRERRHAGRTSSRSSARGARKGAMGDTEHDAPDYDHLFKGAPPHPVDIHTVGGGVPAAASSAEESASSHLLSRPRSCAVQWCSWATQL